MKRLTQMTTMMASKRKLWENDFDQEISLCRMNCVINPDVLCRVLVRKRLSPMYSLKNQMVVVQYDNNVARH